MKTCKICNQNKSEYFFPKGRYRCNECRYKDPHYIYYRRKTLAQKRNIPFYMTRRELIGWLSEQRTDRDSFICFYCGVECFQNIGKPRKNSFTIDRLDNKGPYSIDNIVPCCSKCNGIKQGYDAETFQEKEMFHVD